MDRDQDQPLPLSLPVLLNGYWNVPVARIDIISKNVDWQVLAGSRVTFDISNGVPVAVSLVVEPSEPAVEEDEPDPLEEFVAHAVNYVQEVSETFRRAADGLMSAYARLRASEGPTDTSQDKP